MSNKLQYLVDTIQFVTGKTIDEISSEFGNEGYLRTRLRDGGSKKLYNKIWDKYISEIIAYLEDAGRFYGLKEVNLSQKDESQSPDRQSPLEDLRILRAAADRLEVALKLKGTKESGIAESRKKLAAIAKKDK